METTLEMPNESARQQCRVLMICGASRERQINGGVGIYVHSMVRELRNLGHPVELMWKEDFGLRQGFSDKLLSFLIAGKLARRRFRTSFDVVHVHGELGWLWGLLRRARSRMGPVFVWSTHGLEALTLPLYRKYAKLGIAPHYLLIYLWAYRVIAWCSGVSARTADCSLTSTRTNAVWLRDHYGLDEQHVATISSGVRPEFLELPRPHASRIEHTLFMGTWWWRKGHWLVRDAFVELAPQYPALHLHLWGTRTSESELVGEFPPEIRARVHVRPTFEFSEYLEQLPNVQAFVLPSLYEGGTPLALLEACAAGLACVVSRAPGIIDVVGDPPVASMAKPGDLRSLVVAWKKILDDPPAAYAMGLRARERARQFEWRAVAQQLSETYGRLVASRSGAPARG